MVIEQREENGKDESDPQPEALFLEEIELVAVTVRSESAGAVQHHQPNSDQDSNRQDQDICALFMHSPRGRPGGLNIIHGITNF